MCGLYLVLVLAEGLKDVGLTGEISVRVLQTPQEALLQDQNRDPELVPQQLHSPDPRNNNTQVITEVPAQVWSFLEVWELWGGAAALNISTSCNNTQESGELHSLISQTLNPNQTEGPSCPDLTEGLT